MSKRSHKTVEIKVFLTILLNDRRIRIQEAQKHVDPVDPDSDPDPQHWILDPFHHSDTVHTIMIAVQYGTAGDFIPYTITT